MGTKSQRELIVIGLPERAPRLMARAPGAPQNRGLADLRMQLTQRGNSLQPLFGGAAGAAPAAVSAFAPTTYNETLFFHVVGPDERLEEALETAKKHPSVCAAFIKPASTVPTLNSMAPSGPAPAVATPDFQPRQGYLLPAPGGVDAIYAWSQTGGRGGGVNIIDLEWGWLFSHEDLQSNNKGLLIGPNDTDTDHGTAVLGEMNGAANGFGVTGICPDAMLGTVSFVTLPTATAISRAASLLSPGDLMLLEIHRPGPRFGYQDRPDQLGFIPIEWWPDDFAAIRAAVNRGIIVVEAGGNGAENLDDPLYNTPDPGFPPDWTNPFNRANRDSGAILVGAGCPPSGSSGPDRSRLDFSNYGSSVDAQGWGREVVSTGYGDLQGGPDPNRFYTAQFSGTSSASPIVCGALGCIQGFMKASGQTLTPNLARRILRVTGSAQQASPAAPLTQRIGNRPDLRQAINLIQSGALSPSEPSI